MKTKMLNLFSTFFLLSLDNTFRLEYATNCWEQCISNLSPKTTTLRYSTFEDTYYDNQ